MSEAVRKLQAVILRTTKEDEGSHLIGDEFSIVFLDGLTFIEMRFFPMRCAYTGQVATLRMTISGN